MKTTATVDIYYSNSSTLARTTVFKGTKLMILTLCANQRS
jgi:hypothetical protein